MLEQPRVLIIGRDETEQRRISFALAQFQCDLITASDWVRGLRELYGQRPHVLIHLSAPDTPVSWDEVQVVRSLCDIPVIVVADRASQSSLQQALDLGVAGYLVRPLETAKLVQRIAPILAQAGNAASTVQRSTFSCDGLSIDWRRFEVRVDGRVVRLSPIEFKLLSLLVEHEGEVVSYAEILRRVWGPQYDLTERRNIKLYIWYLRHKLESDPSRPRWIHTRAGVGYIFSADFEEDFVEDKGDRPAAALSVVG